MMTFIPIVVTMFMCNSHLKHVCMGHLTLRLYIYNDQVGVQIRNMRLYGYIALLLSCHIYKTFLAITRRVLEYGYI